MPLQRLIQNGFIIMAGIVLSKGVFALPTQAINASGQAAFDRGIAVGQQQRAALAQALTKRAVTRAVSHPRAQRENQATLRALARRAAELRRRGRAELSVSSSQSLRQDVSSSAWQRITALATAPPAAAVPSKTAVFYHLTRLRALADAEGQWVPDTLRVFAGTAATCREYPLEAKNCCALQGWANRLRLSHCRAAEKRLAFARQAHRTVAMGRYCAKHLLPPLSFQSLPETLTN